jgi:hypothetical protein
MSDRIILLILIFFWFWMGIVYHILFFSSINPLAFAFGVLFIIEACLLIYLGVIKKQVEFSLTMDRYTLIGLIFILYAMIIYPLSGLLPGMVIPDYRHSVCHAPRRYSRSAFF